MKETLVNITGSLFRLAKLEQLEELEKEPFSEIGLEKAENHMHFLIEGWKSWKNIFVIEHFLTISLL